MQVLTSANAGEAECATEKRWHRLDSHEILRLLNMSKNNTVGEVPVQNCLRNSTPTFHWNNGASLSERRVGVGY